MRRHLFKSIQQKLDELVEAGAAPGFQLVLGFKTESLPVICSGHRGPDFTQPVGSSTWFDLASLTKTISIFSLLLFALQKKLIPSVHEPLQTWFPDIKSNLKSKTLIDLLNHRAGLEPVFTENPDDLKRAEKISFFLRSVDQFYSEERDGQVVYSDIGHMLLGVLFEKVFSKRLSKLFPRYFPSSMGLKYAPLKFEFGPLGKFFYRDRVNPSFSIEGDDQWLQGKPQDPRAAWIGGDAGHSGLFGTAMGVETWAKELFESYHGKGLRLQERLLRELLNFDEQFDRFLSGFDTPTQGRFQVSQAGSLASRSTIGFLGYTGCSFWMDIESGLRITLLSHRHGPGRDPEILSKLRPDFHDWLYSEFFPRL